MERAPYHMLGAVPTSFFPQTMKPPISTLLVSTAAPPSPMFDRLPLTLIILLLFYTNYRIEFRLKITFDVHYRSLEGYVCTASNNNPGTDCDRRGICTFAISF